MAIKLLLLFIKGNMIYLLDAGYLNKSYLAHWSNLFTTGILTKFFDGNNKNNQKITKGVLFAFLSIKDHSLKGVDEHVSRKNYVKISKPLQLRMVSQHCSLQQNIRAVNNYLDQSSK